MNKHPYLRAYLAGICVPTIFLVVVATAFTILRYVINIPVPIERVIVFPMAFVPNLWGLWNIVFLVWRDKLHLSLGLHGALLPFLLVPLGFLVTSLLHFSVPALATHVFPFPTLAVIAAFCANGLAALILYYLAWKYLVGFLNAELGIG